MEDHGSFPGHRLPLSDLCVSFAFPLSLHLALDCTQQMEHQEQQQQQNNNKTTKKQARNHIPIYPLMQQ
jgi:hypothetical protein